MGRVKGKHGRFITSSKKWEKLLKNEKVAKWFNRLSSTGTQQLYMKTLDRFFERIGMAPEDFLGLSPKAARDKVWQAVEELLNQKHFGSAQILIAATRHFYRYYNDEKLEFDSRRGGKHYIPEKRQRVLYEIIPDRKQIYTMVDSANGWRDKAVLLVLFQSGIRVNALCRLNYGHVAGQLGRVPIRLKITSDLDTKMRGMDIDYYYTFLGKEAAEAVKQYVKWEEARGIKIEKNTPLFLTQTNKRIIPTVVFTIVKNAAKNAGLDPKGIWPHCLRKAFRKVLNASPMDEDTKEAIMGHKLPGSRGNYFDLHDVDEIERKYAKCNFSRVEALSEEEIRKKAIIDQARLLYPDRTDMLERIVKIVEAAPSIETSIDLIQKLVKQKPETQTNGGNHIYNGNNGAFKVVEEAKLIPLLEQGYEIVKELSNGKIVIKKPS